MYPVFHIVLLPRQDGSTSFDCVFVSEYSAEMFPVLWVVCSSYPPLQRKLLQLYQKDEFLPADATRHMKMLIVTELNDSTDDNKPIAASGYYFAAL
jgi:hypothetical protein